MQYADQNYKLEDSMCVFMLSNVFLYITMVKQNIFCISLWHEIEGKRTYPDWQKNWGKFGDVHAE